MQVEVTFLTRRGPDAVMRKSQTVTADIVRFGRGTDNEVQLPDIRVGLHAAALARARGRTVRRARRRRADARQRRRALPARRVRAGDKISIGPYEIVIVAPGRGLRCGAHGRARAAAGRRARARSRRRTASASAQAGWSKRHWSWALFVLLAIVGLVLPLAVYPFGEVATSSRTVAPFGAVDFITMSWNAGEVSNPHRFFAQNCATCHRGPLVSVADTACLACHATVGSHLEADADLGPSRPELAATRCATATKSIAASTAWSSSAQALCVDCHATLAETAPKAGILNVTGFPAGHPQFRATVVADAAKPSFARVSLAASPPAARPLQPGLLARGAFDRDRVSHAQRPQDHDLRRLPQGGAERAGVPAGHLRRPMPFLPRFEIRRRPAVARSAARRRRRREERGHGFLRPHGAPGRRAGPRCARLRAPSGGNAGRNRPRPSAAARSPGRRGARDARWGSSSTTSAAAPIATSPTTPTENSPSRRWCLRARFLPKRGLRSRPAPGAQLRRLP